MVVHLQGRDGVNGRSTCFPDDRDHKAERNMDSGCMGLHQPTQVAEALRATPALLKRVCAPRHAASGHILTDCAQSSTAWLPRCLGDMLVKLLRRYECHAVEVTRLSCSPYVMPANNVCCLSGLRNLPAALEHST